MNKKFLRIFWYVALIKLATIAIISSSSIGLMPDEAQYWTWSKKLSYNYYSKPLAIAWQIAAGCALFGDTEVGVRVGSTLLSFFLSLAIYLLARRARLDEESSFWCALIFALCPLGVISGFLATVDCGFILFWTLACVAFVDETEDTSNRPISYLRCGLMIAFGALWKWTIYFLWMPIIVFSMVVGRCRFKRLLGGFILSLCGSALAVIWNVRHDFASLHHVAGAVDVFQGYGANTISFLGAQAALASPVVFLLLLWTIVLFARRLREESAALQFCWWTSAGIFLVLIVCSFLKKIQGNWALFAYPTAFVMMTRGMTIYFSKKSRNVLFSLATGISVIMLTLLFCIPYLQQQTRIGRHIPWKMNPWRQGLGLDVLNKALLDRGYNPKEQFLFSSRYQETSQISFYGPEQKLAYFLNIHQLRKNQFSYWPSMSERCVGKTGFFITFLDSDTTARRIKDAEMRFQGLLEPYFSEIERLPFIPMCYVAGKVVKVAIVFRCVEYNGKMPKDAGKY